ncbi:MAG TPA: Fic family protein [Burkholderiales bacterium]|nr:Fic family protein [Burkholderiales bacterium]
MLFRTPQITEREAEVIGEIESIRRQLNLPRLREWPGLPWRAIHDRILQASKNPALGTVLIENAGGAEDEEPGAENPDAWSAAPGYHAALSFVLQVADAPDFAIDEGTIRALHYMMAGHDPEKAPGRWRRESISVKEDSSGKAMYKTPHAKFIPALMAELIASLNANDEVPVFIRAAMAHLNLAAIHPFRDANGRMARALQTFVLARDGVSAPPFASIDEYLSVNTDEYYRILDEVDEGAWQPERDARPWVRFCLTAHFLQARTLLRRTQEYDRLWEELERDVKRRGLAERMISALAEAAIRGSLTAALYESATMASAHEASDDLERLVEAGLLVATSDKGSRCYLAADALKAIRARIHDPEPPDQDPFAA